MERVWGRLSLIMWNLNYSSDGLQPRVVHFFACVLKMLATFTKDDNYNYTAHIEKEQKPHALVFKAISHVVPLILSLYLSFTRLLSPKKKHVQMEVLFFFPEIHFDKLDKLCLLHTIT